VRLLVYPAASRARYPQRRPDDYKEAYRIGGSALILRLTTVEGSKYSKILHLGYAKCLLKAQNGVVSVTRGENGLLRYGFAVLAVGAAFAIKLLLDPLIVQESPFLLILGAIMISAWYGGLGPGLLATVAAGLATDYFSLQPTISFSEFSLETVPLLVFFLEGTLVCLLSEALHASRVRAEGSKLEAERLQERLRRSEKHLEAAANAGRSVEENWLVRDEEGNGPGERVGLSGMRERLSLLGGRFELQSEPGSGTSLTAEVEVPTNREDDEDAA
jgi:glucose-6-phosphate-specific signal transduction histidine kinase